MLNNPITPKEVKKIKTADIIKGFRYRSAGDDTDEARRTHYASTIESLADSIKQSGLIHPIAVREPEPGYEGYSMASKYELLAGGRRLEAITTILHWEEVMATIYRHDITDMDKKIIELFENIERKDFSYAAEVALTGRLHKLMQEVHGEGKRGQKLGHSLRDTAAMLNRSVGSVAADIELAGAIEAIPDLGKMRNRTEAIKTVKSVKRSIETGRTADQIKKHLELSTTPLAVAKKRLIDSFIVGDFLKFASDIQDESADLIEIDPPYAIGYDKQTSTDTEIKVIGTKYNEWDSETYISKMKTVIEHAYRIGARDSWVVLWHATEYRDQMKAILEKAGYRVAKVPAIWTKAEQGSCAHPELEMSSNYEAFLYGRKGAAQIILKGRSNVFTNARVKTSEKICVAEKPIGLMEDIYKILTRPGSTILIPFLGSGNGIFSARRYNCFAFGFDLSQETKEQFTVRVDLELGEERSV